MYATHKSDCPVIKAIRTSEFEVKITALPSPQQWQLELPPFNTHNLNALNRSVFIDDATTFFFFIRSLIREIKNQ